MENIRRNMFVRNEQIRAAEGETVGIEAFFPWRHIALTTKGLAHSADT